MQTIDPAKVEAFAGQLVTSMAGGMVTYMIELGHKIGLFEAAVEGPFTSEELATRSGLTERYVREWLGALATAGVFEYDPADRTYTLPAEHAVCLTGKGSMNLAGMTPMLSYMGKYIGPVSEAFKQGGGVPYSAYRPEFTELMDLLGRDRYDEMLISGYLTLADGLTEKLQTGTRVADLGCGAGHCINLMAQAFPNSTFVGYDIAQDAIDAARKEAAELGLTNATFEVRDVTTLPAASFGVITVFDAVHDQRDPAGVLKAAHDALEPDGIFFVVDINASSNLEDNIGNPLGPVLYSISTLHCMTVSLAEGGVGLGTAWGRQLACRMLAEAGFGNVVVKEIENDPFNVVYVARV